MKRVLLFLLLVALGIVALRFAVGDDEVVTAGPRPDAEQPGAQPRNVPGVSVQQGKIGVTFAQTGELRWPRFRTVRRPDGTEAREQVYLLHAADSQPVREGLQRLETVEVTLFDKDVPNAVLRARQAFVELSTDASGRYSLREDKEIDLRDAVFTTLPGSRLEGLTLELGNAKVQVGEDELLIHTPGENDPVLLRLEGQRSGTLRGKGLQARLPRSREGALRRADVDILHEPVLEMDGVVVQARGRLHYSEDTDSGAAHLTVDDDVRLDFTRAGGLDLTGLGAPNQAPDAPAQSVLARGDRFSGWLLRGKRRGDDGVPREQLDWRVLQLTGAPALVDAPGARLSAPRLTVMPGRLGGPYLVTAHGGASRLEQTATASSPTAGDLVVGTSPRRIHLLRPLEHAGAMHRGFGFQQWTLRPIADLQVVAFEGQSRLAAGLRTVDASEGLHVFQPDARQQAVVARGFGDVRIEQRAKDPREKAVVATGDDGFHMVGTKGKEVLVLGPRAPADADAAGPWRTHRYDLRQGDAHVQGLGGCLVERTGDRTAVRLRAPGTEIGAQLERGGARLVGVRRLDAEFDGESLLSLLAAGLPATATFVQDGETLTAAAPRIEQIGPASWCLLPAAVDDPERIWRGLASADALPRLERDAVATARRGAERVATRAPRIEIHHAGGRHAVVDALAVDGTPAEAEGKLEHQDGRAPTTLALQAARLRLFPFAISPEAMRSHAAGARGLLAELPFSSLRLPWLVGDDVRNVTIRDARQGLVEGEGHQLLLSQGAEAALMLGDPDQLTEARIRRTHGDRVVEARGARVRLFHDEDVRLQALRSFPGRSTFVLPTVTMLQPKSTSALANVAAVCEGDIDVLPDAVVFGGPVVAKGLRADGSLDPEGMQVDSKHLRMQRQPKTGDQNLAKTGDVVKVTGRDVRIDWPRLRARSAEVELDLLRSRLVARDPGRAEVVLPGPMTYTGTRIEVNYSTMSVRAVNGSLRQGDDTVARDR